MKNKSDEEILIGTEFIFKIANGYDMYKNTGQKNLRKISLLQFGGKEFAVRVNKVC